MKLYYKTGNTTLNMPISYASIMLDALSYLLCPILRWHNWHNPVNNMTYAIVTVLIEYVTVNSLLLTSNT